MAPCWLPICQSLSPSSVVFDGLEERWLLHEVRRQPRQYITPRFAEILVHERQELPSTTERTEKTAETEETETEETETEEAKETYPAASGMMPLKVFLPCTYEHDFFQRAQVVVA